MSHAISHQNLSLDAFARKMNLSPDGVGFKTSIESTKGQIYIDSSGKLRNANRHWGTKVPSSGADNWRIRMSLLVAFSQAGASSDFLKKAVRKLGLDEAHSTNFPPLERRLVKRLLADFRQPGAQRAAPQQDEPAKPKSNIPPEIRAIPKGRAMPSGPERAQAVKNVLTAAFQRNVREELKDTVGKLSDQLQVTQRFIADLELKLTKDTVRTATILMPNDGKDQLKRFRSILLNCEGNAYNALIAYARDLGASERTLDMLHRILIGEHKAEAIDELDEDELPNLNIEAVERETKDSTSAPEGLPKDFTNPFDAGFKNEFRKLAKTLVSLPDLAF